MAKGDDAVARKRNKNRRKRMRKESSSSVSARVASIIASKRRRKSGTRRVCEGMCFSLPTPEDPYNDRCGKKILDPKKRKKLGNKKVSKEKKISKGMISDQDVEVIGVKDLKNIKCLNEKDEHNKKVAHLKRAQQELHVNTDSISKFLIMCLTTIQSQWKDDHSVKPLLANKWGFEFWRYCSLGADILETNEPCSGTEQIAWLVSTAADIVTRKEKDGLIINCPFLLFVVPSRERAVKVRSICKPLKALGIHSVSLHAGASIDHQVSGLKNCEPEFIITTPERILELASLRAIDISCVSLLVFDGLESFVGDGNSESIKSIRENVSDEAQTVIFGNCSGNLSNSLVEKLVKEPVSQLSLEDG